MEDVLGEAYWKWVMAYLDDIVIYSDTIEDHVKHVRDVLDQGVIYCIRRSDRDLQNG